MAEKKPRAAKATKKTETTKKTTATAKPKAVRERKPKAATLAAVTPEMIAERAYYIWVDGSGGDAFAHWVQAERELTAA